MARKRHTDDGDEQAKQDDLLEETLEQLGAELVTAQEAPEDHAASEQDMGAMGAEGAAPNEADLEQQGFTPDEVRRLVVVSDRLADSEESRGAEAEMRRLRFTRWLIQHGRLDEWSA